MRALGRLAGELRQRKYALAAACFFVLAAHFAGADAYACLDAPMWGEGAGAGEIFFALVWWRVLRFAAMAVGAVWVWGLWVTAMGALFLGSLNAMCWATFIGSSGLPLLGWCLCLFFTPLEAGVTAAAAVLSVENAIKLVSYPKLSLGLGNLLSITMPLPAYLGGCGCLLLGLTVLEALLFSI